MPSLLDSCQSCLYGLEYGIGIHDFRPTWRCLIDKVLATPAKFLEPSDYLQWSSTTSVFAQQMFLVTSTALWSNSNPKSIYSRIGQHSKRGSSITHCASRRGFSADWLASVPDSQRLMANLKSKGLRLRLGHLRVGELLHWHLCITLDFAVQFKL